MYSLLTNNRIFFFLKKKSRNRLLFNVTLLGVGSAAIFAGRPRKMDKHGACVILDSDLIEDNASCIKRIFTSSRETWSHHLLDIHSENYWQSCGTQGKVSNCLFFFQTRLNA